MAIQNNRNQSAGKNYFCAVELALLVLGGKWKPLILWHLSLEGSLRFGQLKKSIPTITQKMLTQQLRELESDGMVRRTVFAQVPPRVDYALTDFGQGVTPLLKQMYRWGKDYERQFGTTPEPGCPAPSPPLPQETPHEAVALDP